MAEILPFIGMRYNSQLIGNLAKVLAPPYDCISPDLQAELHERHANNVVRMELPVAEDGGDSEDQGFSTQYTRAANALRTWRSDGIMIEDEKPSVYIYEQEFKHDGEVVKRRGFFALVKLEDYGTGKVLPHEFSAEQARTDRHKLIRATKANCSAIFAVHEDPKGEVGELLATRMQEKPWEEVVDEDGVKHRLWVVQKKDFLVGLRDMMKTHPVMIADGHHRYEAALEYRDEQREETGKADGKQPFDYVMMFLTAAEQTNLQPQPVHRALARSFVKEVDMQSALEELADNFTLAKEKVDLAKPAEEGARLLAKLAETGDKTAFAMVMGDGTGYVLKMKPDVDPLELLEDEELDDTVKRQDVAVLHYHIINYVMAGNPEYELEDDECHYPSDAGKALALLKEKKASLVFLLKPIPANDLRKIMKSGQRLPLRSTCFMPKIICGLVVRNMDCEQKKAAKR